MIVTQFGYAMEDLLLKKLDLMVERCSGNGAKKDVVLLCEGAEGEGKTTLSIAIAYYVAEKTGRKFGEPNVFFDLNKMIQFAQSTEEQIIIWDEPSLHALSTDWASNMVKDLTRLLMMIRKKRHFIIINMTKFFKFNEYIVVDRSLGLLHVYSRKNVETGRFVYVKQQNLQWLWRDYRYSKKRNYKLYGSIRGTFPDVMNPDYKGNVLPDFNINGYERNKDNAILQIGSTKPTKRQSEQEGRIRNAIHMLINKEKKPVKEVKLLFDYSERSIRAIAQEMRELAAAEPSIIKKGIQSDDDFPPDDDNDEKLLPIM